MELRNLLLSSLLVVGAMLHCAQTKHQSDESYRAAVFEHSRIIPANDIPHDVAVGANLWYYERAAVLASEQGADLIVYPEYGIFLETNNRTELRQYLEVVPNPKEVSANPCDEKETFTDRPILRNLSCLAKNNNIVIVANMGSLEFCSEDNDECPEDGAWFYNTNVAFDRNGTLVARYYCERLYFQTSYNLPREEQDPTLNTDFGKFAMFIYYDIMYQKMTVTSQLPDVDAVLYSTKWFNSIPFFTSTQWFQAWAMGNDATLLVANLQAPGYALAGSGIFGGTKGSVVHYLNSDNTPKLMVATLPRRNGGNVDPDAKITALVRSNNEDVLPEGTNVTRECSYHVLGTPEDIFNEFRCFNDRVENYTMVKLVEKKGRLRACNNGMCCKLEYEANEMNETFYFGVYKGTHNGYSFGRYFWAQENCFLARCDDANGKVCSDFPTMTDTLFNKIEIKAEVTTQHVYPSFVSNGLRLVPVSDWEFKVKRDSSKIKLKSRSGAQIIAATLMGRAYDRDPPYVR